MNGNEIASYLRLAISLELVDAAVRQLWYFLIIGLLLLLLIAGYVSYRIAKSITRPMEQITRVAMQITDMNYKARVNTKSTDEIGQLGRAINVMADSLQLQMNHIQENESRLTGVLENMVSGVMMIDRDERIPPRNCWARNIRKPSSNLSLPS
jgi:two-component system phosphate regulon sensor histidine kinase PhoR